LRGRGRAGVAGGNFTDVGRQRDTDRLEQFAGNAGGGRAQYQALAMSSSRSIKVSTAGRARLKAANGASATRRALPRASDDIR
jgi:hypothetical protein